MSLEMAELHKLYSNNKFNPSVFFLNPFTDVLFLNNWLWPEDYAVQKKPAVKKAHSGGDSLKQKIKDWFTGLDFQSQRNCLMVKDREFIEGLCYFVPSYSSRHVYNMKKRKSLKSIEVSEENSFLEKGLKLLLESMELAFLKEPVLHVSKNCQKFFSNELIKWMEIISSNKLFQYANKIKQSELIEENILWFCSTSFHRLESFIVNQFEKAIIKGYFNRDRIQSNYFNDIAEFCIVQKDSFKNKNIETELLGLPLFKAAQLSLKEIQSKFADMKQIQEKYEQEKEKLIQKLLEDQIETPDKEQGKKKKRRIRKKFKVQEQVEPSKEESPSKKCSPLKSPKKSVLKPQTKQKVKNAKTFIIEQQMVQEEQKIQSVFNDEISHISKCEDLEFHETDVTFQKYFENEEKAALNDNEPRNIVQKCEDTSTQEKNMKKISENFEEKDQIQESAMQTRTQNSDQANGKSNMNLKQKKKSKKEKVIEGLQDSLIKSIRNNAFTQFIDSISIESNKLYNFKLSAYQFIVFFISSLLPTTNITLFGSNAVGLSLASSDIDIMISNNRWLNISEVRQVLYHIGNEICKMGWVIDYRLILNAKVPVLKLFIDPKVDYFGHSPLKYASQTNLMESIVIKADIIVNIEGEKNIGCDSTLLMKEWLTDHPQLQRIILFFKYVLWYYGLNENYRGGICSYCLFLMVVSCLFNKVEALKTGEKDISQVLEDDDEGTYILQILKYYSETFDPAKDEILFTKELKLSQGIDIKEKNEQMNGLKRNLTLKVIDPINGEYIESSFSKFQEIQQLFSMILVESMKLDDETKRYLNGNEEVSEEFAKYYQSFLHGNAGMNVITKNSDQSGDAKGKKLVKKIFGKIKKNQSIKYNVKDIVGIGFKIGIQNWMSNGSGYSEQKFNV